MRVLEKREAGGRGRSGAAGDGVADARTGIEGSMAKVSRLLRTVSAGGVGR